MKKICFLMIIMLSSISAMAQTPKSVLDKTSTALNNKGGISATFNLSNEGMGATEGKICVKGQKVYANMPQIELWFDGKTQWVYMKETEEVNMSIPTLEEIQLINPYSFLNIYKKGFRYTMKDKAGYYEIHLISTDKKRTVSEMYITVSKTTYLPSEIRMQQRGRWSIITISKLEKENLADNIFRFPQKKYPNAEIIDLR